MNLRQTAPPALANDLAGAEYLIPYDISLAGTCMKCHSNKAEFCDRCHDYAGVSPDCWSCHVAPQEG